MAGLNDGLGNEELGNLGSQVANVWVTGSVVSQSQISGLDVFAAGSAQAVRVIGTQVYGTTVSGTTAFLTNASGTALAYPTLNSTAGSPYYNGVILQFAAETIITGGQWVTVSGAAGGASVKAKAAVVSTAPLGVATATVASGATVSVLTNGLAYFIAEGTIGNGQHVKMGAGLALNTVMESVTASGARGVALAGAGSEGRSLVYLW